jgi:hypothetical protein
MSSSGHTLGQYNRYEGDGFTVSFLGRWPTNVILSENIEVSTGFPEGRSSGIFNAQDHHNGKSIQGATNFALGKGIPANMYCDSGSASRFFKQVRG